MSIVGSRPNSITVYRGSEQNALIHKNMFHLRDNSGKREFDKVNLALKSNMKNIRARKKRQKATAERIINMRFPNINKYDSEQQKIKEDYEMNIDNQKDSIRLNKAERWVSQDLINAEEARENRLNNSEDEDDDKRIRIQVRETTSNRKKFDTERLIKPTYSSLKRGRVLPRDPKTNHTVSTLKTSKIFSPTNPRQARKLLERNVYLNNTNDQNFDLNNQHQSTKSGFIEDENLNKTVQAKFVPNTKNPAHIKNMSGYINSKNGFETFLKKKDEIPRLSILENYKQISRIMRNSFLKAKDLEQRFKNNALTNEELKKKNEEEENTMKLTKILKQMNSPRNAFATPENSVVL